MRRTDIYLRCYTLLAMLGALFPYLALSLSYTGAGLGIGRPLREHRGRRGRPRISIARIEAIQPFTGERRDVFRAGAQAATSQRSSSHRRSLQPGRPLCRLMG